MDQNSFSIDWELINDPKSKTFNYLIGDSTDSLLSQQPKKIDVLRLYYNFSRTVPESEKVSAIVKQIENRYRDGITRIKGTETIRIKTKRLIKSCKDFIAKRKMCLKSGSEKRKQEAFHRSIHGSFDITQNVSLDAASDDLSDSTMESTDSFSSSGAVSESEKPVSSDDHDSDPDPDPDSDPDSDPDYNPSPRKKIQIAEALLEKVNASKGSFRLCENLLKVGVQIAGGNPNAYSLSKTSLWNQITLLRSKQKNELLSLLAADTCKIVLQFDGKSYTRINERHVAIEERIIVLCHTEKGDVPLGLFIVRSHSGFDCAMQIIHALTEHNLMRRIVGLLCDTEHVNTGEYNGACAIVERELKANLLHLMCRHHIAEVILKDVFVAIFGASQASRMMTFDVLNENWDFIKSTNFDYSPVDYEELIETRLLDHLTEEAINTINIHASSDSIRNDYAELNDLVLKFLGKRTGKPFKVPGATNNARWMSRAIYALKTYLFRQHLGLDPDFVHSIRRFCVFVALVYTKYWNRCSIAVDAPINDLKLMKELDLYKGEDAEIAHVALRALKRHLWYLGDELVVLAFFSDKVSNEEKFDMALMLTPIITRRTENSIKHTAEINDIQGLELSHFVSTRSLFLFDRLEIDTGFLFEDPNSWNGRKSFKIAQQTVRDLITVVNDSAERALQLGANLITNQRVQSESRLQDFIVSTYAE